MLYMQSVSKRQQTSEPVSRVNLHALPGKLYVLVGAKGSGKSTVLKLAAGLIAPDSGRIIIDGHSMDNKNNKRKRYNLVGYVAAVPEMAPGLRLMEYMEFYGHIYGKYGLSARERCREVLQMVRLEKRSDVLMGNLPKSALRLAQVARALIHKPKLLLLDYPFLGMEEKEQEIMDEILKKLHDEVAIVQTCESFADAVSYCDSLGLMEEGSIVMQGSRDAVLERVRGKSPIYMEIRSDPETAAVAIRKQEAVVNYTRRDNQFRIWFSGDMDGEARLLKSLIDEGVEINSFYRGIDV